MKLAPSLSTLAPLVLLSLGPTARPQQSGEAGPLPVGLAELVLEPYPVQHVDADELFELAQELVGRDVHVKENGGLDGSSLRNLTRLGRTLVLYDTKERVQRARELLARLDLPRTAPAEDWQVAEYKPRFLSLDAVEEAVKAVLGSWSRVEERGLIVFQATAAEVAAVRALLERVDVPEKQVYLTCQLVEVAESPKGPPLPKELTENLQRLLSLGTFEQIGLGLIKSSVTSGTEISVQIEAIDGSAYTFALTPVAFDDETGTLTAANCYLVEQLGDGATRELFRTQTALRAGEYTALAATGAAARLLVVRFQPQ